MWELVQVSAQYSNAVLLAVLPHVTDFSQKLDLPIITPITAAQVREFKCDPRAGQTGGAIVLTNGSIFAFLEGRVCVFRSAKSYYSLQEPELVPQFYGPVKLKEQEALQIARSTIGKLGYQNVVFNADSAPLVTPPERAGTNYIPRYLFRWLDPNWLKPKETESIFPSLLEVEVNASSGQVEMWITTSRDTRRPSPKVDVVPPLLHPRTSELQLTGGVPTSPTNDAYARAFLKVILPQLSCFITNVGLNIPTPITPNQVVLGTYACRILEGEPMAQLYLTNGDRFNYQHGYFAGFYAHDAMDKFPETGKAEDFLGQIKVSTNQAISLCETALRNLGYAGKLLAPVISYAPLRGHLACTRFTFFWKHPGQDSPFASFEVDMETKTIKSVFLNDPSFRREPPQIDLPIRTNPPQPKPAESESERRVPNLPAAKSLK
jgi:hypothetical protein